MPQIGHTFLLMFRLQLSAARRLHLLSRFHSPVRSPSRFLFQHGQTESSTAYKARRDSWINITMLFIGFIPILSFGLGSWQLRRLQWKVALIDELEEKLQLDPLSLPKRVNLAVVPEFVFRKVNLRGRWDHTHLMLLGPRVREGTNGFHLVMPLIRKDGSTVLVDRGFVSKDALDNAIHDKEEDEIQVLGLLRTTHTRNSFTPDNNPQEGTWYWADVGAMADFAGGEAANVQPIFIEEIFEGHLGEVSSRLSKGIPIGRPATVDLRNAHLSYVITWYSLSALTGAMFISLMLKRRATIVRRLPR